MTIADDFATLGLTMEPVLPSLSSLGGQFLRMSRVVHPDKHPDPAEKHMWDRKFVELNEAYHRVEAYITANSEPSDDSTDEDTLLRQFYRGHNDIKMK